MIRKLIVEIDARKRQDILTFVGKAQETVAPTIWHYLYLPAL